MKKERIKPTRRELIIYLTLAYEQKLHRPKMDLISLALQFSGRRAKRPDFETLMQMTVKELFDTNAQ